MSLEENVRRIRSRFEEKAIYAACHKRLFHISFNILRNRMQAEEVMHDTLLRYFETAIVFPSDRDRDMWMARVCVNFSLDQLKKNKKEDNIFVVDNMVFYEDAEPPPGDQKEEEFSFRGITATDIKKSMDRLAAGYRIVLTLFLFDGYDYEEIAQITGLKESSVRSQYARGRAKLIAYLKEKHGRA